MRRAFLLLSILSIVVAGCNPGQETIKWPTRAKEYTSIASLSPSTTELAAGMVYSLKLVGRTAACNYPASVRSAPVVAQVKPDYEKLRAQSPGLVIYDKALYNDQDIQQIKALGFDTFEFKATTIDDYERELLKFGSLVSAEDEATSYADKIEGEKRAALGDPINPKPKVVVIMPGGSGEHMIAGTKSFQADMVRVSGGDLVGPDADKFVSINAEQLVQLNPDMIITAGKPDSLLADPRLQSITAIKKKHLRGLDQDLVMRRGQRVDKTISLLHRALQNMAQGLDN